MKRFLIGAFCLTTLVFSACSTFAADKYLCKWTNESGTNRSTYIQGMDAETYCLPRKYIGDDAYQKCLTKDFEELKKIYNAGKCKKYEQKIHYDTNNSAQCVVDITDDPADGYNIKCYGPTADTFRPKVEALYRNR